MNTPHDPIEEKFAEELKALLDAITAEKPVLICFMVDGCCRVLTRRLSGSLAVPALGAISGLAQRTGRQIASHSAKHGGISVAEAYAAFLEAFTRALSGEGDELHQRARKVPRDPNA